MVELGELIASHDDALAANPDFPAELQPRDRSRAASGEQIQRLAGGLVPELLGVSANVADGAPIVGPDGVVESGNGRVMALRRAYAGEMDSAGRYRAWLESQGHDVAGMTAPVLIRRRNEDMDAAGRADLTRRANERTTASMSATEQAQADSAHLTPELLGMIESDDVAAAANRPFVRAFLARLSDSDRGALVDKDGKLSLDGRRRIRGALLFRAYGDPPRAAEQLGDPGGMALVERLLEDDEGGVGPLGRALLDVAPSWARLDDPASTAVLTDAVRAVLRQRDSGQPIHHALQQLDMPFAGEHGGGLSEDAQAFLASWLAFDKKGNSRLRGRDRIRDLLERYLDEAGKTGSANASGEADLLGHAPALPGAMMRAIAGKSEAELKGFIDALGLDLEAATAADLRNATQAGPTLFQPAWHGGPHIFDNFSTDAIGTGEGAQAYGWGLYFAGRREVAEWYRKTLAKPKIIIDGEPLDTGDYRYHWARKFYEKYGGNADAFQKLVDEKIGHFRRSLKENAEHLSQDMVEEHFEEVAALESLRGVTSIEIEKEPGRTYGVELAPEDHELLDWDKRGPDQSGHVKAALRSLGVEPEAVKPYTVEHVEGEGWDVYHPGGWSVLDDYFDTREEAEAYAAERTAKSDGSGAERGSQMYARLGSAKEASLALREAGIRGIKYLDGSSRRKGDGSHNFVIFDAGDVEIREYFQSQGDESGPFGPILRGFEGDYHGAALELEARQEGEAPGALYHPDVGPISLAWGHSGDDRATGFGLAKIIDQHPEVVADLPKRVAEMRVKQRSKTRIDLRSKNAVAGVLLKYDGTRGAWLLTAYERSNEKSGKDRKRRRSQATSGALRDLFKAAGAPSTARRRAKGAHRGPLKQDDKGTPQGARGSITFGDGRTLIRLFEKADLSTVLHESGHLYLEVMQRMAAREGATAGIQADLATVRDWLGAKDGQTLSVDQHEQFARGFEAYLMEGPSSPGGRHPSSCNRPSTASVPG